MKKHKLKSALVVALFVTLIAIAVWWTMPHYHEEHATVISSQNSIVTIETDDGNLYEIYGWTTAHEVTALFRDSMLVDITTIR